MQQPGAGGWIVLLYPAIFTPYRFFARLCMYNLAKMGIMRNCVLSAFQSILPFIITRPQYAVISVGTGNSYGHPCEDTLSRLHDEGTTVFRTDLQGTIVCYSNGQQLSFKTTYDVTDPAILFEGASESDVLASYDESEDDVLETPLDEAAFIGNLNTKKFHYPDCSYVGK